MKKTILITIGILIILIVIGVWVYLFMYGTPKSTSEIFTRFGFGDTVVEDIPVIPDTTIDVKDETDVGEPQKLKQLTTKPVAGAVFVNEGIRYVEQGTGHVYDINLKTGDETLVRGTTIPQSITALFSSDGTYVAITALDGGGMKTILETVSSEKNASPDEGVSLPLGATNLAFGKATGTLMYLLGDTAGSIGYSYNVLKDTSVQLFKIPLRDVRILWGAPTYVHTIPTAYQSGYLYQIVKNDLAYVRQGQFSLTALSYDSGIVATGYSGESINSIAQTSSGEEMEVPLPLIPEKCTANHASNTSFFCGVPVNIADSIFPDDWYKGSVAYSDMLWEIDVENGSATALSDPLSETGRAIDISAIGTDTMGKLIHLINKNDNTLWMFDTTL